jgi:energy-converting hydrogenase Eha subunit A
MFRSPRARAWLFAVLAIILAALFWGLPRYLPDQPIRIEFTNGKDSR